MASPVLGSGDGDGADAGAFDGLTEGFTEKLLSGAIGGGAGMGGRRSSINRFAEQQSRWGFVPGEEDTLNINMNMPGRPWAVWGMLFIGMLDLWAHPVAVQTNTTTHASMLTDIPPYVTQTCQAMC